MAGPFSRDDTIIYKYNIIMYCEVFSCATNDGMLMTNLMQLRSNKSNFLKPLVVVLQLILKVNVKQETQHNIYANPRKHTHTHTHTHKRRERERMRE